MLPPLRLQPRHNKRQPLRRPLRAEEQVVGPVVVAGHRAERRVAAAAGPVVARQRVRLLQRRRQRARAR